MIHFESLNLLKLQFTSFQSNMEWMITAEYSYWDKRPVYLSTSNRNMNGGEETLNFICKCFKKN